MNVLRDCTARVLARHYLAKRRFWKNQEEIQEIYCLLGAVEKGVEIAWWGDEWPTQCRKIRVVSRNIFVWFNIFVINWLRWTGGIVEEPSPAGRATSVIFQRICTIMQQEIGGNARFLRLLCALVHSC